ncbi:MAG: HTH-type transcriptional repressor YvoA [Firmicutes bacterium]|nr:HTH-type transcriptional repressor YvoA [Bacillota bacterium]
MHRSRSPLYVEIASEIKQRISLGIYPSGQQLPTEPVLACEMGVSRGTLRESLSVLEREGLLLRRHGVGSFVKKQPSKVVAGMEKLDSLYNTIESAGRKAEDKVIRICQERLEPSISRSLELEDDSEGYIIESIRLADGIPVIYCWDVIPLWVLGKERLLVGREWCSSLTEFFRKFTSHRPKQFVSSVIAVLPPKAVTKMLAVDVLTPMILMEGVLYDANDRAINFGRQYYRSDKYEFTLVRK